MVWIKYRINWMPIRIIERYDCGFGANFMFAFWGDYIFSFRIVFEVEIEIDKFKPIDRLP